MVSPSEEVLISKPPVVTTMKANELNAQFLRTVPTLRILAPNNNTIALQTTIRNISSTREDFVFDADRLIRLVIEDALNHLPSTAKTVTTPPGGTYEGVSFAKSNCGVSIVRSGEAMEKGLRDACRAIRIGKIIIEKYESFDSQKATLSVLYAKLPDDVSLRKVLLLYPIINTGATVIKAIQLLLERNVKEANIILINLFATPKAIKAVSSRFTKVTIQTVDIHPIVPVHFGRKYFGTD
ncbi:PREDICTED: uracil phosphoribosyltransferase homolog [Rhagoletis zephyria]|uniref:uracil phosphoribosyltransferase homolog n=1 Tax=Rhagoletis zephyria TaxID=28612 RepID=UPI0008113E1F|nr:PREDICTED: uracil phosphoribosyltransferase homolog [Rhagoletis zephyria]